MARHIRFQTAVLVLSVATAGAAHADDWGQARDDYANDPAYAQSKAQCRRVAQARPPKADRPSARDAAALKGCDSEKLYYGEGTPADPVRARLCAFAETDGGEGTSDEVFSGQTILMMLYANGRGVKPDLDLAIHYACNIDGAPAELDGRVNHLAEIKAKGPGKDPFDFCNDITSGLGEGYCAARSQTGADARRGQELDALAARVQPAARPAFAALRKAAYDWADARSGGEVDMSGTARAAMSIEAEEESRDAFLKLLRRVIDKGPLAGTPAGAQAADAALNGAYHKLRATSAKAQDMGTVTFEGIQTAQRAWLKYRDAFLAFARAQGQPTDGLAVALSAARTAQLNELIGG